MEYHPCDIGRHAIQDAYKKHRQEVTDFDWFIVAYHRPKNLRDALTRTKFPEEEGDYQVSSFPSLTDTKFGGHDLGNPVATTVVSPKKNSPSFGLLKRPGPTLRFGLPGLLSDGLRLSKFLKN